MGSAAAYGLRSTHPTHLSLSCARHVGTHDALQATASYALDERFRIEEGEDAK